MGVVAIPVASRDVVGVVGLWTFVIFKLDEPGLVPSAESARCKSEDVSISVQYYYSENLLTMTRILDRRAFHGRSRTS
jgi:hypothetical protein